MRALWQKVRCLFGRHNTVISLQHGRPAVVHCRACSLVIVRTGL